MLAANPLLYDAKNREVEVVPRSKLFREEKITGYLFVLPVVIGLLAFFLVPMISSMALSFTRYDVLRPAKFIWFRNYTDLLTRDPMFITALYNTTYMALVGVPVSLLMAFALSLVLNSRSLKGLGIYRTVFFLPYITPLVAMSVLWLWMLNSQWGIINQALAMLNIKGPMWLADPNWSKPSIIMMRLFSVGPTMLIFLAGLQGVPSHLYEAAKIDGANAWKLTWHITLPFMTPTIFFNLVMGMIGAFQIFTEAYVLTQGGPTNSTLFIVYYLFNNAFAFFKMGYASAMAWLLFILIFIITRIQFFLSNRWVNYDT